MKQSVLLVLGFAAAALSTTTSLPPALYPTTPVTDSVITITTEGNTFTVPVFDASTALTFGTSSPVPTTESQHESGHSNSASSSSTPANSPRSPSPTSPSSTTTSAPAEQTSNAARPIQPEIVGALAGGLFAGMALI